MDPVIELATVTVSYLWIWRELFPDTARLTSDTRLSAESITKHPDVDMAVYARMRDLTLRQHDEPVIAATGGGETTAVDATDTDIAQLVRRLAAERTARAAASGGTQAQGGPPKVKWYDTKATPADLVAAKTHIAEKYTNDLRAILGVLGAVDLTGGTSDARSGTGSGRNSAGPMSRERLTSGLARTVLRHGQAAALARALNYRPLLLWDVGADVSTLDDRDYPRQLVARCTTQGVPLPFALVLHEELDEIERSRALRDPMPRPANDDPPPILAGPTLALDRAAGQGLLGLSFSGGGIRSATFNLGVLQGLANAGWLPRIDYLSTVSGGGYIGAWLLAWIKRRGSIASVQQSLRGAVAHCETPNDAFDNTDPSSEHVRPIRLLREYSSYLTPHGGFFSADTWTMIAIWLRNTSLNLIVLALFLMGLLVAPRVLGLVFITLQAPVFSAAAAAVLILWAAGLAGWNLGTFDRRPAPTDGCTPARGDSALVIALTLVLPLFVGAFLVTAALWVAPGLADPRQGLFWLPRVPQLLRLPEQSNLVFLLSFLVSAVGLVLAAFIANYRAAAGDVYASYHSARERLWIGMRSSAWTIVTGGIAAMAGALLLVLFCRTIVPIALEDTQRGAWVAVAFGPLVTLMLMSTVIVVYLGLEGAAFQDERREWWSRVGAWISLIGGAWALISCISFFAPLWIARLGLYAQVAGIGWGAVTGAGAWLAASGKSNGHNLAFDRIALTRWLIRVAPFVFIVGFLSILSIATHLLLAEAQIKGIFGEPLFTVFPLPQLELRRYVETYWAMLEPRSILPLALTILFILVASTLAWRIDVNEFSMHHFYRNRLVRAYLGASRSTQHRSPNAFTGLDLDDDVRLWRFQTRDPSSENDASSDCRGGFIGPYPVINATLNTSGGEDLAWQERKGQSFAFTPLYSGFDFAVKQVGQPERTRSQFAYQRSDRYGYAPGTGTFNGGGADGGLGIGTAIAISGAAANPNSGYHTSPGVAFLLTVLNARLGWWIGNPRMDRWQTTSPRQGLFYLMSELFGYAGTRRKYVNLSDGGHFDNLGLYELVRRRCEYIIVCDAEQDEGYGFEGFANAIRKCRVDFGVVITLQTHGINPPQGTNNSTVHACIGTISYPGLEKCGRLIYLKASVTGDEPVDVLEYKRRFSEFPHQTTGDQWFDESQFESYRALGLHIADVTLSPWPAGLTGFKNDENGKAFDAVADNIERLRRTAKVSDG